MESSTATRPTTTTLKSPDTNGLLDRLHQAQQAAKPVPKKGDNKAQDYKYATAEDVIVAAAKYLQDAGLVAVMMFDAIEINPITSKGGGHGMFVQVAASLRIFDPGSGEAIDVTGYGTGVDFPGDKAVYKAQTGGAKYCYSAALAMPFADDPEHDRGVPADAGGAPAISPKQMEFFANLVKDKAPNGADQAMIDRITLWGASELTGGRGGSMSKAIDGLKDNTAETWRRLSEAAQEWTPPSDGPPPDLADLPPPDPPGEQKDGDQTTIL